MTNSELFENPSDNEGTIENKYANWTTEDLIKKALSADEHIKTIEKENALYRDSRNTDERLKEVLQKLDNIKTESTATNYQSNNEGNNPWPTTSSSTSISLEEVKKLIDTSISETQRQSQAKANVEKVRAELQKIWGDTYPDKLKSRAKELGVEQSYLESMAEQQPNLFLKAVIPTSTSTSSPNTHVPPTNTVNPTGINSGDKYSDFSRMMKENPSLRSDPNFRKRMEEAAVKHGDSFFNL